MADPVALPNPLWDAIGESIRTLRDRRCCTQAMLAEAVGFSRTSIANIEAGRQRCALDSLYDIATALDANVQQLLPGDTTEAESEAFLRAERLAADLATARETLRRVRSALNGE